MTSITAAYNSEGPAKPDITSLVVDTNVLTKQQIEKLHGLFSGKTAGNLDELLFLNANIPYWDSLVKNCSDTYYPIRDSELGRRAGNVVANIIAPPESITLVARGAATKFDKEALVIKALQNSGHRIVSVAHIDESPAALDHSVASGKKLLPDGVLHQRVLGNMYDPHLKYEVHGDREISTSFGLTFGNIAGSPDVDFTHATQVLTQRLLGIKRQMDKNGHSEGARPASLIATHDVVNDAEVIKAAYSGAEHDELAINSLRIVFNHTAIDNFLLPERNYYDSENYYSSRGYRAVQSFDIILEDKAYHISKGQVLWTGNSVKLPESKIKSCYDMAGFQYKYPADITDGRIICPQVFAKL